MVSFLVKRLVSFLPILLLITVISFATCTFGKPTDAAMQFNPKVSLEARQRMESSTGLISRCMSATWLSRIRRLDFGQ